MKKKKIILIAVSLAILAGGGGLALWRFYGQAQSNLCHGNRKQRRDIGVGNRHRNYRTGNRSRSRYTGIRNYRQNLCGL